MTSLPIRPQGCQGHSCHLISPIGQAHNGACHCLDDVPIQSRHEIMKTLHYYRKLVKHLSGLPVFFFAAPDIHLNSFASYLTRKGWYPHRCGDLQHNTHEERVLIPKTIDQAMLVLHSLSIIENRSELAIYLDILEESLVQTVKTR